jgi:hypothetical protein
LAVKQGRRRFETPGFHLVVKSLSLRVFSCAPREGNPRAENEKTVWPINPAKGKNYVRRVYEDFILPL